MSSVLCQFTGCSSPIFDPPDSACSSPVVLLTCVLRALDFSGVTWHRWGRSGLGSCWSKVGQFQVGKGPVGSWLWVLLA
jgi:hypothetical protein